MACVERKFIEYCYLIPVSLHGFLIITTFESCSHFEKEFDNKTMDILANLSPYDDLLSHLHAKLPFSVVIFSYNCNNCANSA